jgi:hypothetical protein
MSTSTPENPLFGGNSSSNNRSNFLKNNNEDSFNQVIDIEEESNSRSNTLSTGSFPESFHKSPEPLLVKPTLQYLAATATATATQGPSPPLHQPTPAATTGTDHHYHLLGQIREDQVSNDSTDDLLSDASDASHSVRTLPLTQPYYRPYYASTRMVYAISKRVFQQEEFAVATWIGFWALLNVTCANYVLTPMRDAVALQVGVRHIPKLTLASSVLAFLSSVPIGWLFEAPDPSRRKVWKKMGCTRGATQGTSLALFYRFFALSLLSYAAGFQIVDLVQNGNLSWIPPLKSWFDTKSLHDETDPLQADTAATLSIISAMWAWIPYILSQLGHVMYIAFFLVVHLMKLHSISLVWGVTSEAMEYEDVARKGHKPKLQQQQHPAVSPPPAVKTKTRLQRLALVGFGGTLGGLWGR